MALSHEVISQFAKLVDKVFNSSFVAKVLVSIEIFNCASIYSIKLSNGIW